MRRDLETNASMAALVLEQLLSSAADEGVTIKLDMDKTEDEGQCASPPAFKTCHIG